MRTSDYPEVKHIGIIGCSAEGAALCYRTICAEGPARLGRHNHPEITMHTHPLALYMERIYRDDWLGVGDLMLDSVERVRAGGAQFCISPDNTIHKAFDYVVARSPLPWLHIAEEVGKVAVERGYRRVGLTGTKYLVEGPVYPGSLESIGIELITPDLKEREEINRIIFDELVNGIIHEASRRRFVEIIGRMGEAGCEAVILGCTEIPLLIDDTVSPLPTLDSTRLLARAALEFAVAGRNLLGYTR